MAGFVTGINMIDDFSAKIVRFEVYTTEEAICLAQEFKEPFISQFKFRSQLLSLFYCYLRGNVKRQTFNMTQHHG